MKALITSIFFILDLTTLSFGQTNGSKEIKMSSSHPYFEKIKVDSTWNESTTQYKYQVTYFCKNGNIVRVPLMSESRYKCVMSSANIKTCKK